MRNRHLASLTVLTLAAACGTKDPRAPGSGGQPETTAPVGSGVALADDQEVTSEEASAQVDDAIAGVIEDQDAAAPQALALAGWDKDTEAKRFRECKTDGDKAAVEIDQSFAKDRAVDGRVRKGSISFKSLEARTRVWSKAGGAVACADDGKHAAIDGATMASYTLDVSFKNERSRTMHLENLKSGKVVDRSMARSATGTRHIVWTSAAAANGVLTDLKTVSIDAARSLKATDKDGSMHTSTRTVKTDAAAPLVIAVERKADTKDLVQRTIKSGKLIASNATGRIETTFDNVVFKKGDGCVASAGKISGALFTAGADAARVSFVVELETQTVIFSDGRRAEFGGDGCELDAPDVPTDEPSSADVPEHV